MSAKGFNGSIQSFNTDLKKYIDTKLEATQGAVVADLNQTISATYDQTEVQALSDKVDELLAALRAAGIIAT